MPRRHTPDRFVAILAGHKPVGKKAGLLGRSGLTTAGSKSGINLEVSYLLVDRSCLVARSVLAGKFGLTRRSGLAGRSDLVGRSGLASLACRAGRQQSQASQQKISSKWLSSTSIKYSEVQ